MRANFIKQAGWLSLFLFAALGGTRAGPNEDVNFDNIDVIDASLNGKLAVLRVGSDIGTNKLLTIFVGLRNKTGHTLNLEIETIYKDTFGNALNSGSWISFTIKAHEESEYRSSTITEQATDFLVRVRRESPGVTHT